MQQILTVYIIPRLLDAVQLQAYRSSGQYSRQTQHKLHTDKVAGAKMQVQNRQKATETYIFMPECLVKKGES